VLLVRTYLPYPYRTGQHAVVESGLYPEVWRPCWLATPPSPENLVELHVRAGQRDPVGTAIVGRVQVGDKLRLRAAEGELTLDGADRGDLLLIAEDTGIAPADALLAELHALGANADPERHAGLRTPHWRRRLLDALRARAGADGRIALSFELVYGHAFNPPPRPKVAAETKVPLDDLRAMVRGSRPPPLSS